MINITEDMSEKEVKAAIDANYAECYVEVKLKEGSAEEQIAQVRDLVKEHQKKYGWVQIDDGPTVYIAEGTVSESLHQLLIDEFEGYSEDGE